MSNPSNQTQGREPKVFMITDGRDYKYYIDPALEIIRHEGTGLFIYEGDYGHPSIEVTFESDPTETEQLGYEAKGIEIPGHCQSGWKANGISFMFYDLKRMLYNEYCNG